MRLLLVHVGLSSLLLFIAACGGGDGPDPECQPGQSRCQADLLQGCDGGVWISSADCAALGQTCGADPVSGEPACLDAPPVCTDDDLRCTGDTLERCANGAWGTDTDCAGLGQTCGTDPVSGLPACLDTPPDCTDDDLRCTGDTLERCAAGAWQTDTDCAGLGQTCGTDPVSGLPACLDTPPDCTDDELRCTGDTLERCTAGTWQTDTDCLDNGQLCRVDADSGLAGCEALSWNRIPTEIDDPVVNGTSLMMPIDAISYAYDPASGLMATAFGSAYDDPDILFLWLLDTATGRHYKLFLSGDPLAADTPFCVDGEDWCQYIGFDPTSQEWIVVGPSTPALMRVTAAGVASQVATSGDRPPDSWISRKHRYDWDTRTLWEYGAVGPSSFSNGLYALDLDTGVWSLVVADLPQIKDNCLVVDGQAGLAYSFGGDTTDDGGYTVTPVGTYLTIDADSGTHQELPLPAAMDLRGNINCALDPTRGLVFLLGGSVVNDYWNEIENEYHNDLWALRLSDGVFFELVPDGPMGTFLEPDQYGDRAFEGDPAGPNFGQNPGLMTYSSTEDRLLVIGEVPIFTHEQAYWMDLTGVEALVTP